MSRRSELVHFERKDFSIARSAAILWRALQKKRRLGVELTAEECVQLSGLAEHQIEGAMVFLASATGGELKETEHGLTATYSVTNRPSWTLRLPPRLAGFASQIQNMVRPHIPNLVGGAVMYPLGIISILYGSFMFTNVPDVGVLKYLVGFGAVFGLTVGSVITIPFTILVLAISTPITFLVAIGESLIAGQYLVSAMVVVIGIFYAFFFMYLLPFVFAFNTWSYSLLRYLFAGFLNWGVERKGPMEDEEEFLRFLNSKRGRITRWNLMVHYGWTEQRAFEELTRLMVDYGGDVDVDDHGRIEFQFPSYFRAESENVEHNRPRSPREVFSKSKWSERVGWLLWAFFSAPIVGLMLQNQGVDWTVVLISLWPIFALVRRAYVRFKASRFRAMTDRFEWLDRVQNSESIDADMVDAVTFADLGLVFDEETTSVSHPDVQEYRSSVSAI